MKKNFFGKYRKCSRCITMLSLTLTGLLSITAGPLQSAQQREYYQIVADNAVYGVYQSEQQAVEAVVSARRMAYQQDENIVLSDFTYTIEATTSMPSVQDETENNLCKKMLESDRNQMVSCYELTIGDFSVFLLSKEDAINVLEQILDIYDTNQDFTVVLNEDALPEHRADTLQVTRNGDVLSGDITSIVFADTVELMQAYTDTAQILSPDAVVADIVANTRINILLCRQERYTEEYYMDTIYVEEDDWYTGKEEVVTQGEAGVHEITASVTYLNGVAISSNEIQNSVVKEPVAEVVKVGTKERPSFIKPLSGGSFSSGFGARWGRRHEGVDWSCSTGTKVMASCNGRVSFAGWQNGYGNCIVITHDEGIKTRYAHLSSIKVSVGQKVSQGDTIALSGNTGNSTGPHLHFEIIKDGEPVNPLKYL